MVARECWLIYEEMLICIQKEKKKLAKLAPTKPSNINIKKSFGITLVNRKYKRSLEQCRILFYSNWRDTGQLSSRSSQVSLFHLDLFHLGLLKSISRSSAFESLAFRRLVSGSSIIGSSVFRSSVFRLILTSVSISTLILTFTSLDS